MNVFRKFLIAIASVYFLLVPVIAVGDEAVVGQKNLITPIVSGSSEQELRSNGCESIKINEKGKIRSALALGWQPVIIAEVVEDSIMFCPAGVVGEFKQDSRGQVAGLTSEALAQGGPPPACSDGHDNDWDGAVDGADTNCSGPADNSEQSLLTEVALSGPKAGLKLINFVAPVVTAIASFIAGTALMALNFLGYVLTFLLTISEFTSYRVVTDLWPIVLGITNLGFLLAMLVIALLITLRLDSGSGVRRMLPRLFIGAILVNFSLVICGVVLDVLRLSMAALSLVIPGGINLDSMGNEIWNMANIDGLQYAFGKVLIFMEANNAEAIGAIMSAIVGWMVVAAVAVVCVSLLFRYIALIFLIVASPLAYLFIAFPGTTGLAKKWWMTFLKYAFYGPVVIVIIVAIGKLGSLGAPSFFNTLDPAIYYNSGVETVTYGQRNASLVLIMKNLVAVVGLFLAATAGKYAGIIGSSAAMAIASRTGQRARGMAYRGGSKPFRAAGRTGRDFAKAGYDVVRARLTGAKPGQSLGAKAGEAMFGKPKPISRAQRKMAGDAARAAQSTAAGTSRLHDDLSAGRLSNKNVGERLASTTQGRAAINDVARHSDNSTGDEQGRLSSLVRNKEMMKKLNADQRLELQLSIQANASLGGPEKQELINELHNTIARAERDE